MDKTDERKIYELGYLLVPYLSTRDVSLGEAGGPGDVLSMVDSAIKAKIEAAGGEFTSGLDPVMTRLAYTITKVINNKHTNFSDAYFGALRFKAEPGAIKKLEVGWKKDDDIIRFLLISLPKGSENIVAPKRVFARLSAQTGGEDKPFAIERLMPEKVEERSVLSAEELDKEIDKLVI